MAKDIKPEEDGKPAPATHNESESKKPVTSQHMQKHYAVALIGIVAVVLAFVAGAGVMRSHYDREDTTRPMGVGGFVMGGPGHASFGGEGRRLNSSDDNTNRLSGVVTAVNGTTFTIGGHGATNSVVTNSTTQFTGGDKVAVNDSVLVSGVVANGTFTATRVIINP